jgi:hypothetical protein
MSPEHLLLALYQLCHDADQAVALISRETLLGLPKEMLLGAIAKLDRPEPLDYLAMLFSANTTRMDEILRNKATADETFENVARRCIKDVADLVAINQQRLLRQPTIIEALYFNKNTRMSTVDRIVSFAIRQGLVLDGIPAFRELAAAIGSDPHNEQTPQGSAMQVHEQDRLFDEIAEIGSPDETLQDRETLELMGTATAGTMGDDGLFDEFEDSPAQGGGNPDIFSEFDRDKKEFEAKDDSNQDSLSATYQISTLSVSQKIRLALLGNASHRALLIMDSNKLVSMAAIKSPQVNDQEVLKYANSRSVSEDVIRFIATRREWTRNYFVKVHLVNNPKTPLPTAMQFLPHMRRHDIKALASNKNVPNALAIAAKNIMKRQQKNSG